MPLNNQTRQRVLLTLLNQISQNLGNLNTNASNTTNSNISIDFPGIDVDVSLPDLNPSTPSTPSDPQPDTIREVLLNLLNQQVEVTLAFDTITGTLSSVQDDYVVIIEGDGSLVLVPINQIELVNEL
ncbi:DUF2642 domain-containing protein [Tuberibacillus sp. Marseille-P3662]|uniref:DUF2642 domain-containing protein n=1 Tax=Tuberibacillus sp. Marseille-P3662 TaxID=1965358 RepID=UPI000A1C7C41|nr:DUF2642 domain-containing protein [Tuberibacillus sp. Marseille-P3662]